MTVKEAIALGVGREGCSDIHIIGGDPIKLRVAGRIVALDDVVTTESIDAFIKEFLDEKKQGQLRGHGACDAMAYIDGGQVRVHAHKEHRGIRLALRLTRRTIPKIEKLGLPPEIGPWTDRSSGLILVCGPAGSGKTTLLAALVNKLNNPDRGAIVTIERPVEYVHPQHGLYVSQIEVGRDTQSFESGSRAALQSDLDVLMIGEVNDSESAKVMMTATETGHLVLASMHAPDTVLALDRIATWGGQGGLVQITHSLIGIVALRLVPGVDGDIVPAAEILVMNDAIRKMIREERFHQIRSVMESDPNMRTLGKDLKRLVSEGRIDLPTAKRFAPRQEEM